jgi:hypothetical protein
MLVAVKQHLELMYSTTAVPLGGRGKSNRWESWGAVRVGTWRYSICSDSESPCAGGQACQGLGEIIEKNLVTWMKGRKSDDGCRLGTPTILFRFHFSFQAVPSFVENFGPSHTSQPPLSDCRKRMPSHGHRGPSNWRKWYSIFSRKLEVVLRFPHAITLSPKIWGSFHSSSHFCKIYFCQASDLACDKEPMMIFRAR